LDLLERSIVLQGLSERERHILCRAIWHHNKYKVSEEEIDVLLFCRLIRDADKLDILYVITDYFDRRDKQPNFALDFGLNDSPGFSREALEDIMNCRMVGIENLKNLNDMKLMYLSWAFDLNFSFTVSRVLEESYLAKLIDCLPKNGDMQRVRDRIMGYER